MKPASRRTEAHALLAEEVGFRNKISFSIVKWENKNSEKFKRLLLLYWQLLIM